MKGRSARYSRSSTSGCAGSSRSPMSSEGISWHSSAHSPIPPRATCRRSCHSRSPADCPSTHKRDDKPPPGEAERGLVMRQSRGSVAGVLRDVRSDVHLLLRDRVQHLVLLTRESHRRDRATGPYEIGPAESFERQLETTFLPNRVQNVLHSAPEPSERYRRESGPHARSIQVIHRRLKLPEASVRLGPVEDDFGEANHVEIIVAVAGDVLVRERLQRS